MNDHASWSTRQKILVVAPNEDAGERLARWLVDSGYVVSRYREARKFVELAGEEQPDLVIVDMEGTGEDEQTAVASVCTGSELPTPTLVLMGDTDRARPPSQGTCSLDWMDEGVPSDKLLTRVRAMLRVAFDDRETETEKSAGATRDRLTRVYNRRYFDERIEMEIERARRYSRKLSCVMIDIDGFKDINAKYGHEAGDGVLKVLADVLLSSTRSSDVIARYGGEEFVIISPEADGSEAGVLGERLRRAFEESSVGIGDEPITISCGVATYPDHASDSATLLRMADSAVYRAKADGRNQCVVAFSEVDEEFESANLPSGRILLVEDNDYDRCVASLVLRASGYEVLEACDCELGVTLARSEHPDLIIIDLQIAGTGGIETTRQIAQMDEMKNVPIVALTSSDGGEELEELARAGCRGYITKPIDTNLLASQVQLYLEG